MATNFLGPYEVDEDSGVPVLTYSLKRNEPYVLSVTFCKDCEHYEDDHCLTWCKKFRHRTNANGYCAWPDDSAVR